MHKAYVYTEIHVDLESVHHLRQRLLTTCPNVTADKREFIKISQAVGMGFVIMGVIGYVVKLSMFPGLNSSQSVGEQGDDNQMELVVL